MMISGYRLTVSRFIIFWFISYMTGQQIGVSFLLAIAMVIIWHFVISRCSISLKFKHKLNKEQRGIRLNNEQELLFEEHMRWDEKKRVNE